MPPKGPTPVVGGGKGRHDKLPIEAEVPRRAGKVC